MTVGFFQGIEKCLYMPQYPSHPLHAVLGGFDFMLSFPLILDNLLWDCHSKNLREKAYPECYYIKHPNEKH